MRVVSPSMAGFGILPPLRGSPRAHDPPLKDFAGRGESAGTAGERLPVFLRFALAVLCLCGANSANVPT